MYLKNIEVQGFKSFANKILFEFHDGITGIVGPNGSGKSNVADAVRWVLGEQSAKQLRGGNMQDVIFSGTENRSPQSYAKVTITMDNSDHTLDIDFDEVAVTRKLYRSGESEYLLNNSPCRLKDVQELFYDTGIGKEGYSIIGQGQIDKILSGKPDDRRELFDEAVGIVKYKRRKNQTQKKLDSERANITRVNDILEELERQVGPLAKQSEKAKQFLNYKEELKSYDINMFLIENKRLSSDLEKYKTNLNNISRELENSQKKLQEVKEKQAIGETDLENITEEINDLKNQQNQASLLKKQLEGQIGVLEEQLKSQDVRDAHFNDKVSELKLEIDKRNKEKQKLEFENKDLKDALEKATQEKEKIGADINDTKNRIEELELKIEEKQAWIMEELNRRNAISGDSKRFEVLLDQNKKNKADITRRLIEIKSDEGEISERAKKQADLLASVCDEIKEKKSVLDGQKTDLGSFNEAIDKLNKKFEQANTEYHIANSKLESLKNMTERYDGYGNAVKSVMEQKKTQLGIKGVVADIIKTKQKYELAIEIALGASIQNIVVEDEETGKKLIEYLKNNKLGRATFLPLSALKNSKEFKFKEAITEKGSLGLASTLVETLPEYSDLAISLLGRILVVDSIDSAILISKKYKNSFQIVTVDGENFRPGGSMSGGRYKNSSSLLSRMREIKDYEKQVKDLDDEIKEIKKNIEHATTSKKQSENLISKITLELHGLEIRQHEEQIKLEDSKTKLDSYNKELENLKNESSKLDEEVEEVNKDKINTANDLENSEKEEEEARKSIAVLEKELAVLKDEYDNKEKDQEEFLLSVSRLEQKYSFVTDNFNKLDSEILEYETGLNSLIDNNNNSEKIRNEKHDEIKKLKNSIKEGEDLVENILKDIAEKEIIKQELTEKNKSSIEKREEIITHNSELDKEEYRLKTKVEGLEESLEKQINYMWEEYELTYDSALSLRNEDLSDVSFMRRRINELKRDIRNLGAVNVNAIEEYKSVGERYEFLKTQRDDLIEAESSLMEIISELDKNMLIQFKEQFTKINEEYNKVFKSLFGGGKGYLELVDPENLLETGIKIIAQPPGKKLQNMMQLSGGEKALTAIALLFAIQNLKPSPFCLLDEIEAALDDSNVDKFADYLHDMTRNTQFIVITHRRGTMTSADRLYGITMQEKGVSALVSVDLVEEALDD